MAKLTGEEKREFLERMAAGRKKAGRKGARKKAGRVTGRKVTAKRGRGRKGRRAGSTAIVHAPAVLPSRKGHPRGAIGTGTPAVRLARVEHAVQDLARASHAIVGKLVDHEKRIGKVESIASQWVKGRHK